MISKIQVLMEDSKTLKEAEFDKLFQVYKECFSFYNKSLELMRKILVYFPIDRDEEQAELLSLYNLVSREEKDAIMQVLKEKVKRDVKETGTTDKPE